MLASLIFSFVLDNIGSIEMIGIVKIGRKAEIEHEPAASGPAMNKNDERLG
jgi:hypothetical protein